MRKEKFNIHTNSMIKRRNQIYDLNRNSYSSPYVSCILGLRIHNGINP